MTGSSSSLPPLGYGVATASYQVEGALDAGGRGASIWDVFAARPGAVVDGSDGSTACGSWERWEDDLDLVAGLGVDAYRFSVAWPRVQPDGTGPALSAGLDHYERVVDGLLARGVRPMVTLYHWDLPQALEDAGGWPARATAERFAEYAGLVATRLGDRVAQWTTHNEPWCSAFLGYAAGVHAPGRREPEAALAAAHHLLLGHAWGAQAVRAEVSGADVGIVLNLAPVLAGPGADPAAVDVVDAVQNRVWLDPLVDGTYPSVLPVPGVQDGDLEAVRGSAAWLGVNYYTPIRVAPPSEDPAVRAQGLDTGAFPWAPPFRFAPREPHTAMGWEVHADSLTDLLVAVARRAPGVPLRVTENGAAYDDLVVAADGSVVDEDRIAYLEQHLAAVHRARAAGAPVLDYVAWTLLDNFEWAEGYTKTFGLVAVDRADGYRRTPKASYRWYADHVAAARAASA